jgi:hypothetical protein
LRERTGEKMARMRKRKWRRKTEKGERLKEKSSKRYG